MILRFLIRRILALIPVVLGVTIVTFGIMHLTAGGHIPGLQLSPSLRPDEVAQIRHQLGLDRPVVTQYLSWLGNALHGNFGLSLEDHTSVMGDILQRLPATLELTGTAMFLGLLFAIPVGVIGAARRGSKLDHALTSVSVAGFAIPQFWLGLVLILLFSVQFSKWGLPALPQSGDASPTGGGLGDHLAHLVLPAVVLSFYYVSTWSRYLRSSMVEVLSQDYIRTALAKGATNRRAVIVHGLRNAIISLVTLLGLAVPYLISGALVVEIVFSWPGIGLLAYQRAQDFDYTTVLGITTFVAFLVILGSFLADIAALLLDPRIASGMRSEAGR
jgi:peptide/nickel transport system permease protein